MSTTVQKGIYMFWETREGYYYNLDKVFSIFIDKMTEDNSPVFEKGFKVCGLLFDGSEIRNITLWWEVAEDCSDEAEILIQNKLQEIIKFQNYKGN